MTKPHVHHWKVDTPNGEESVGRCKCGAERTFGNSHLNDKVMKRNPNGTKKNWNDLAVGGRAAARSTRSECANWPRANALPRRGRTARPSKSDEGGLRSFTLTRSIG